MMRRVAAYGLFATGVLLIAFFRGYSGRIVPHPVLFYVLGGICFVAGFLIIRSLPQFKARAEYRKFMQAVDDIRANGIVVKVDLSACEIKDHTYIEEAFPDKGPSAMSFFTHMEHYIREWDKITYHCADGQKEICQSVLKYTCSYQGREKIFVSPVIAKDKATLGFLLDIQKETVVYVDKNNADRYYFDVGFLQRP